MFIIIYNIVVYIVVYRKIRKDVMKAVRDTLSENINNDLLNRLRFYPIVLLVCYTAVTAKRLYEFYQPNNNIFWLTWLSGFSISLCGILNSIVYGLSKEVRQQLQGLCQRTNRDFDNETDTSSNRDQLIVN